MAALTALAGPAAAAEAIEIAIAAGDSPELARKIRAEVSYAGFEAVDAPGPTSATPATVRILSPERVQLSVQRASDGGRFELTLERRPAEGDSYALRVVEALRARLVDVGWALPAPVGAEPSEATENQSAANQPPAREPSPGAITAGVELAPVGAEPAGAGAPRSASDVTSGLRLWLGGGAAGAWSSGGLGVTPHAAISLRAELGADWGAALVAHLPMVETELEASEGEASVAWSAYSAAIERALPLPAPWFGAAGLGGGVFLVDARGQGRGDFSGQRERLMCGAGFVELSVGSDLTEWLRWRATALAGATAPRPVLRFDGREVASLGRAFGSLGLALELSWPEPREVAR